MGRITDANGVLIRDLWVDQPDALQQLKLRKSPEVPAVVVQAVVVQAMPFAASFRMHDQFQMDDRVVRLIRRTNG